MAGSSVGEQRRDVVDQPGLVAVDQVGQQPPSSSGSRSFCFHGSIASVQVLDRVIRYRGGSSPRRLSESQRGRRHQLANPGAVRPDHLLRVVLPAHLPHRRVDDASRSRQSPSINPGSPARFHSSVVVVVPMLAAALVLFLALVIPVRESRIGSGHCCRTSRRDRAGDADERVSARRISVNRFRRPRRQARRLHWRGISALHHRSLCLDRRLRPSRRHRDKAGCEPENSTRGRFLRHPLPRDARAKRWVERGTTMQTRVSFAVSSPVPVPVDPPGRRRPGGGAGASAPRRRPGPATVRRRPGLPPDPARPCAAGPSTGTARAAAPSARAGGLGDVRPIIGLDRLSRGPDSSSTTSHVPAYVSQSGWATYAPSSAWTGLPDRVRLAELYSRGGPPG